MFVYGREVDDFSVVDYNAIAMLNVSATQEIYRQMDVLKKENESLKAKIATLESKQVLHQEMLGEIDAKLQILSQQPEKSI